VGQLTFLKIDPICHLAKPFDFRISPIHGAIMKRFKDLFWPLVALVACGWSVKLLYGKLYKEVASDPATSAQLAISDFWGDLGVIATAIGSKIAAIPASGYALAALSTLVAYAALAWYDRIALLHLGKKGISWLYISVCSFVTYAIGHNIGASIFSGGLVRYRAYSAKGLTAAEVAVLVALTSFTFVFGTLLLAGVVFLYEPQIITYFTETLPGGFKTPVWVADIAAAGLLGFCALYVLGSWLQLRPLKIKSFTLEYPKIPIVSRQLFAAPLELIGAAGIIYFALPEMGNPGFMVVLGAFLLSFSAGLVAQVPGGIGVMEAVFIAVFKGVGSSISDTEVFAALLVWRLFYLIIPLIISIPVVLLFERSQIGKATRGMAVPEELKKAH
jgi:glycosyltransferase 2 family protein